ncbi:MAG TPA: hypothetical protein DEQ38_09185 [Elusimicrobia bacterium]|nr:MAG: hypothetical protein A2089_01445 [Elusimicrobia bacterium GWD2_63_28]HCC48268.1 hypothetical protein [Elusimicrobiota bacterium]
MKRRALFVWLSGALAAAAIAGAVSAPAEVLADLSFFRDFELLASLEILEDEQAGGAAILVSTEAALSTAPVAGSSATVKNSTSAWRAYETR